MAKGEGRPPAAELGKEAARQKKVKVTLPRVTSLDRPIPDATPKPKKPKP